jgi:predicted alpha/beta superfamily hydrolase
MTGPTTVPSDLDIAPRVGGSAAFRRFIKEELMPEIEASFPVNARRGIIGESLAGLFIMETLAEDPGMFDTYIALSPSLWWNDAALVGKLKQLRQLPNNTRVYLASADEDNIVPHVEALRVSQKPNRNGWVIEARPDLNHSTIYRTLGPLAIRMLYPKAKP